MPLSRLLLPVALIVLLSACKGIGSGTKPESIRIIPSGSTITSEETETKAYSCVRTALILIGEFSDDSLGDFTSRAHWTSDDPSIVGVSNGDEAVPGSDDAFFGYGSLSPKKAGTTTIRAEYLGFTAAITVVVSSASDFRLVPDPDLTNGLPMLHNTLRQMKATVFADGETRDVTGVTIFSVEGDDDDDDDTDPDDPSDIDNIATLSDTGELVSYAQNGTVTMQARLNIDGCEGNTLKPISRLVKVQDLPDNELSGLFISYQDPNPADPAGTARLAEGTRKTLLMQARFADYNGDGDAEDDNEVQDMSAQFQRSAVISDSDPSTDDDPIEVVSLGTLFTSSNIDVATFPPAALLSTTNLLTAIRDTNTVGETITISATFGGKARTEALNAANDGQSDDASDNLVTYNFAQGTYSYTVDKFAVGDKLVFGFADGKPALTVTNGNTNDGNVTITGTLNGQSVTLNLTGLTAGDDAAIDDVDGFNERFGSGSLSAAKDSDGETADPGELPMQASNTLSLTIVDAPVEALTLATDKNTIKPGESALVTVKGSFQGGTYEQDLTRDVAWSALNSSGKSSSDVSIAVARDTENNRYVLRVTSLKNEQSTVTIRATATNVADVTTDDVVKDITLEVVPEEEE
jgi:hypothetical protein